MLFDVEGDPLELHNLADRPECAAKRESILAAMMARWDEADLEERVRVSQRKRLFVQDAMKFGRFPSWDFDPPYDAARVCVRGGLDPSTTATKQRGRFPFVPVTPPQHPRHGGQ